MQARNFPLWFRAGKKVCGADSQSSYLSENTGEEGAKSGKNKEKIKRPSWVYCVTNTVGLLSRLSEIWNKSFLIPIKAKSFFSNIINALLINLARSRWLDISLVLFFFAICLDHDFVSVHKKAWLMTYLYEKSSLPMWGKYVNQRLHNDWDIKFCNWWSKGYFSLLFGLMFRVLTPNAEESANKIVIVIIVVDRTYSYRNLSKFFYGMVWLRLLLFHSYGILCP